VRAVCQAQTIEAYRRPSRLGCLSYPAPGSRPRAARAGGGRAGRAGVAPAAGARARQRGGGSDRARAARGRVCRPARRASRCGAGRGRGTRARARLAARQGGGHRCAGRLQPSAAPCLVSSHTCLYPVGAKDMRLALPVNAPGLALVGVHAATDLDRLCAELGHESGHAVAMMQSQPFAGPARSLKQNSPARARRRVARRGRAGRRAERAHAEGVAAARAGAARGRLVRRRPTWWPELPRAATAAWPPRALPACVAPV